MSFLAPLLAGAASGIAGGLMGGGSGLRKVPTLTKEQKQLLNNQIQQALQLQGPGGGYQNAIGLLQQYLNPQSDVYQNFEQPYLDEFYQKIIPGIAERFAGYGGGQGGALSSSGFGQALSSAGANLQTNLAQMKSGMQRNAILDLLNQYNTLSGSSLSAQPFGYQDKGAGILPSALSGALSNINFSGMSGQNSNRRNSYQAQYPLTNYYDQNFRAQGVY